MKSKKAGFNTQVVHAGMGKDPLGSLAVPIYQTSAFAFKSARHGAELFEGKGEGYIYTRIQNPTTETLEETVAELEHGFGGIATASGMGAVATVYMALLDKEAHLVGTDSVYGPSRGLAEKHLSRFGVASTWVDTSDLGKIRSALRPKTAVLYIETPSNPAMTVTDIAAAADLIHSHGGLLVVDNTFASPYLQNPLDLGADVVLHSITKFINGHADLVGGIIVPKTEGLYKRIRPLMVTLGCNMDPHQAFLALRGLKTLGLRIDRAQENAVKIAAWLEAHPKVAAVRYLGLESHPQYTLAVKQMRGPGTMICFEMHGGFEAGQRLMDSVKVATLAVSLGGVETLIQHPASMTHSGMAEKDRFAAGITPGLIRYSVGIEDVEDLLGDLEQALGNV